VQASLQPRSEPPAVVPRPDLLAAATALTGGPAARVLGDEAPGGVGLRVGILALQGDVTEHEGVLAGLGAQPIRVLRAADLEALDALVIPGGESTTMSLLLESSGLFEPVAAALAGGMPALGTCAGMILLAAEVLDGRGDQRCFGAIDISVRRNAFGRQAQSFECDLQVAGVEGGPMRAVFIRAPAVERAGPSVEVLAAVEGRRGVAERAHWPVVCRQGSVLVSAFHPELSGDWRLHQLLLSAAALRADPGPGEPPGNRPRRADPAASSR
jgi:5'-phosphate synthase pdxT subunit